MKLWHKVRNKICPKRISQYGSVAHWIFDDRNMLEKVCDKIDKYFENRQRISKEKFYFKPFFDISTNQWINSAKQIDKICKQKGLAYMTFREIDSEAKRYKKINMEEERRTVKKDMGKIMMDLQQGRSFVKEAREKIRKGYYEIGQREVCNQ